MHTIHKRLKAAFPFVGKRSGTEMDALEFCSANDVSVEYRADVESGIYTIFRAENVPDKHAIFVNSRLCGWQLLYVLFHEIGHFLFHVPAARPSFGVEVFGFHGKAKQHFEAEATAALLLLPAHEIEQVLIAGEFRDNESLAGLIAVRLDLFARGII